MRLGTRKLHCILLVLTVLGNDIPPVQSALVERDWLTAGDGLITYDTATGLEWLDVPATMDIPYNDVIVAINALPEFSGFVFASRQQVERFFNSGGLLNFFDGSNALDEVQKVEQFLGYWGVIWYLGNGQRTEFLTSNTQGLPAGQHWSGRLVWFPPGTAAYTAELNPRADNGDNGFPFGSALIRNALAVTIDGDINKDGNTDAGDYMIMRDIVLGKAVDGTTIEPGHGDFYPIDNPDGIIDMSDLIIMQHHMF